MMEYRCQKVRFTLISLLLSFGIAGCDALQTSNVPDPPLLNRTFSNVSIVGNGGEVGTQTSVVVTMVDKQGYGFANYTPTITAVDGNGSSSAITYAACGVTNNSGVASCLITSNTAGTFTLVLNSPTYATGGQVSFTQVPRGLAFVTQPATSTVSETALATQPTVEILDNVGNLIPSSDGTTVTIALTSANGATLGCASGSGCTTASTTGSSSLASFSNLEVDLSGTYTFTASASGLTSAVSNSFTITTGTASKLVFTTAPTSSTAANTAFATQPIVSLEDAQGNVIGTNNTCVVTLSLTTDVNASDSLVGNQLSIKTTAGVASFAGSNLRINTEYGGSTYVITAAPSAACGTSISSATTSALTITLAGVPASILLTQAPAATDTLNVAFTTQPTVTVYDSFGNVASSDNSTVITVSYSSYSTGGTAGTLVGSTSIGVTNGVATFSDLAIDESAAPATDAGTYVLEYTATNPNVASFPAYTSGSIYVNDNGTIPAKMVFQTQPAKAAKLQTMSAFTVAIEDANGYICSNDNTDTVTIAAIPEAGNTSGGSASGTLTVTAVNGIATFNAIDINDPGVYLMQASATLNSVAVTADSGTFAITNYGSADHPSFTTEPSSTSTTVGAAFTTQPVVAIKDVGGNTVTNDSTSVITLTCINPSGCSLLGNTSVTVTNGVATFSGLSFGSAEAAAVLLATISSTSDTTLSSTTTDSTSFTVSGAGSSGTQLTFSTQPATTSTTESAALTTQPVVEVLTSAGALASTDSSTLVTLTCVAPSGCTLTGTTELMDVNGVVTFTDIGVNEPATTTGVILQATATSLTSGDSNAFTIP